MFFSTHRIVQAIAHHYHLNQKEICSRLPSTPKAKEAQIVLVRLLYRNGEGVSGNWDAVGRFSRVQDPKSCMFGSEPTSYRAILEELEQRPEFIPDEVPPAPDPPPNPPDEERSFRVAEGVSGRPHRERHPKPPRISHPPSPAPAPVPIWKHFLEAELDEISMAERVALGAARMERALVEGASLSIYELRPGKQRAIFEDTARFLRNVGIQDQQFGRIVAPPRTGKTVIAGQIIAASQMVTTYVVPTKTLVRQAEKDLQRQLPGVPVGVYFSEEKRLVKWGVNITTYSMMNRLFEQNGHLPPEITSSSLIFCDEGHRTMSRARQRALRDGLDPKAVRIALTGSEDFNERRRLRMYFPYLIHQVTIKEALELKMFAPARVYVAEVDVSASSVQLVSGELDQEGLGQIMSSAPFFEGARVYRYHGDNRYKQALICCSGVTQALELHKYLKDNRPEGTPEPVVVLADTANRETILDAFAEGEIDTLINVGVLIEGWDAPKCKILIDLAPTCSLVRGTQKYFRPMTVWEDHEAFIYVLLPKELRAVPVLPMDLFGFGRRDYSQGELIAPAAERKKDESDPTKRPQMPRVEKVTLASRFLFQGIFAPPELDPEDDAQILEVLLWIPEVSEESVPGYKEFLRTPIRHELFSGFGHGLLSFLGLSVSPKEGKWQYLEFIARYLPEAAYQLWAKYTGERDPGDSCEPDRRHLLEELHNERDSWAQAQSFADCWRAVACHAEILQGEAVEPGFDRRFLWEALDKTLDQLERRERRVLELRFGLFGRTAELTLDEVGEVFDLTRERIRGIESHALRKLRAEHVAKPLRGFWEDGI